MFRTKWHNNISTGTPQTGASNAGLVDRDRDYKPISDFTACCQLCDLLGVINTVPQVVTLIAPSKREGLLMAGNDDEMFMTKSVNVTPKTTEQHLISRSDKSVAYVANDKTLLDVLYY